MKPVLVAVFIGLGVISAAEPTSFAGPWAGYFFDAPAGALRSVRGVPGSAVFGPAIFEGLSSAVLCPGGTRAIVRTDALYHLVRLAPSVSVEPLGKVVEPVTRAVWAADGSAAVLYSSDARTLQPVVVTATAVEVRHAREISLPDGDVTALAVTAGARQIVVALRSAEAGGVYLIQSSGPAVRVLAMDDPVALVFDGTGRRLFAADRSTRSVVEVRDPGGAADIVRALPAVDGNIVALAMSRDASSLLIATEAPNQVAIVDLATGHNGGAVALDVAPAELLPLTDRSIFSLGGRTRPDEPLWVLDTRRFDPAVYFVPSGATGE